MIPSPRCNACHRPRKRTIQYPQRLRLYTTPSDYWMPAFVDMTASAASARHRDFQVGAVEAIVLGRGEALADVGYRPRSPKAVPLHRMYASGAQEQMLLSVFHALRCHLHA